MFDRIALRYDLLNSVISFRLHHSWRQAALDALSARPGDQILDLGTGTGELACALAKRTAQVQIVGVDFSPAMLAIARTKADRLSLSTCRFELGDALRLPYEDNSFDGAITAFMLRNVADLPLCLQEMRRVVRPGRPLVALELSKPPNPWFRWLYRVYSYSLIPALGRLLQGVGWPYAYLPRSVDQFPMQAELARMMQNAGWRHVRFRCLSAGIVSLHVGEA